MARIFYFLPQFQIILAEQHRTLVANHTGKRWRKNKHWHKKRKSLCTLFWTSTRHTRYLALKINKSVWSWASFVAFDFLVLVVSYRNPSRWPHLPPLFSSAACLCAFFWLCLSQNYSILHYSQVPFIFIFILHFSCLFVLIMLLFYSECILCLVQGFLTLMPLLDV